MKNTSGKKLRQATQTAQSFRKEAFEVSASQEVFVVV